MSVRGYGLKHWWRAARFPGESLKSFARRHSDARGTTTGAMWLARKRRARNTLRTRDSGAIA